MTAPGCWVQQIRLYNFRNYVDEVIEFGPGLTVIAGRNAQGKTNLLEAIATVALTRSPRAAVTGDVLRWGTDESAVLAEVHRPPAPLTVGLKLRRDRADARVIRSTTVDDKPRSARDILGICPVVLFSPDDLQLIKAGPEGRRRRLDVLLSQLDRKVAVDLLRYRRVLEQRNAELRLLRAEPRDVATLESFSAELAACGGRIRSARSRLVADLAPAAQAALTEISGGEQLGLEYLDEHERPIGLPSPTEAEATLRETLGRRRNDELARGLTLAGPHRDDIAVRLGAQPARSAASQGQQRSIVLALALAEVQHVADHAGITPVVIFDDVLSELDRGRRDRLLEYLAGAGEIQVLVTTSEPDVVERLQVSGARHLVVDAGRVRDAEFVPAMSVRSDHPRANS